jgi:regulator of extracellular matrix RemA (YlzA/DUF370 family)
MTLFTRSVLAVAADALRLSAAIQETLADRLSKAVRR